MRQGKVILLNNVCTQFKCVNKLALCYLLRLLLSLYFERRLVYMIFRRVLHILQKESTHHYNHHLHNILCHIFCILRPERDVIATIIAEPCVLSIHFIVIINKK